MQVGKYREKNRGYGNSKASATSNVPKKWGVMIKGGIMPLSIAKNSLLPKFFTYRSLIDENGEILIKF
jgi:hypothetical protein